MAANQRKCVAIANRRGDPEPLVVVFIGWNDDASASLPFFEKAIL